MKYYWKCDPGCTMGQFNTLKAIKLQASFKIGLQTGNTRCMIRGCFDNLLDKDPKGQKNCRSSDLWSCTFSTTVDLQYRQNQKVMIVFWEPLLTPESVDYVTIWQGQAQGQSGAALRKVLLQKNQVVETAGHFWKKINLLQRTFYL